MQHMQTIQRLRRAINVLATALVLGSLVPAQAHEGEEHGDHDAQHGGFVMMYEDLHFELVARGEGGVDVYYTDAVRAQLPATTVSDLIVEIERIDGSIENLSMDISSDGGYWTGASKPIASPEDIVRVGFVFQDNPLVLDIPFSAMAGTTEEAVDHGAMDHGAAPAESAEHHGH